MKKWRLTLLFAAALAATFLAPAGCGCGDDDDDDAGDGAFEDAEIIANYADNVVIATYAWLADEAAGLNLAVIAFGDDPSDGLLEAAREAWVDTRTPWEQSEGFLFGPVDSLGLDPALDSWPVNRNDLDAVLASDDELTEEYVANLDPTLKGFHTIEYLLFGEGGAKTAGDFTEREFSYLVAVTADLAGAADTLEKSWTEGVDGAEPYRDVFATAGQEGNTAYPSLTAAAQEIVDGMEGIADEVANGKIADPFDNQDPTLVESQFSYNSLRDFSDNIRGILNAYTGGVPGAGTSGRGLSDFVAERDPDLDARVKQTIDEAIDALAAIPHPFRDAITDEDAADEIVAAQEAIRALFQVIEQDLRALVIG
ncbi:peptidase M75 [bacterium]|nr:peptidase M75 [bacterium]